MTRILSLISSIVALGLLAPSVLHAQAARLSLEQLPPVYVVAEKSDELATRSGCQMQTFTGKTTSFLVDQNMPYPVVPSDADTGQDDGQAEIFFCSREAVDSLTVLGQVSGLIDTIVGGISTAFGAVTGTVGNVVSKILGPVVALIAALLANVFIFFLNMVTAGATYFLTFGGFLTHPAVLAGWPFVLGFANLGFVLALLFIALSTVLRIEGFQARRMLPRLLLAALMINFSLIIAVFIIDASRLVMAVIASGIANTTGCVGSPIECMPANVLANSKLVEAAFNINAEGALLQNQVTPKLLSGVGVVDAIAALVIVALVTLSFAILSGVLMVRWFMLIILLILSPLAYLFVALPGTSHWARMWWEKFIKYVIYGPVIVLVLALFTQAQGPIYTSLQNFFGDRNAAIRDTLASVMMTGVTAAFLLGASTIAQQLGSLGGGLASKGFKGGARLGARWSGRGVERIPGISQPVAFARGVRGYFKGMEDRQKARVAGQEKPGYKLGRGREKRQISEEDIQKAEMDERVREFSRLKARGQIRNAAGQIDPTLQFDEWNAANFPAGAQQQQGTWAATKGNVGKAAGGLWNYVKNTASSWATPVKKPYQWAANRRQAAAQQQQVANVNNQPGGPQIANQITPDQLSQPHVAANLSPQLSQDVLMHGNQQQQDALISALSSLTPDQANHVMDNNEQTIRLILQSGSQQEVQQLVSNGTISSRILGNFSLRGLLNGRRETGNIQTAVASANSALAQAQDTRRFGLDMSGSAAQTKT